MDYNTDYTNISIIKFHTLICERMSIMKINAKRITAFVLTLVLTFSMIVVAVNAADPAKPYIKVTSCNNKAVGESDCTVEIKLSAQTKLDKIEKMSFKYDKDRIQIVSVTPAADVTATVDTATLGVINTEVTAAVDNTSANEKTIFTVKFNFIGSVAGYTALELVNTTADPFNATCDGAALPAAKVVGEDAKTYTDAVGLGLATFITSAGEVTPGAPTTATIKFVFRTAMDPKYYHGSDIPAYDQVKLNVKAGQATHTQATLLAYVKQSVQLYNDMNGDLDTDNDGIDDLSIDGIMLNQWIVDNTAGKYDLGDFVLNETTVAFNDMKLDGTEKYNEDAAKNVYTVYFDQVNVPQEVLVAVAQNLGKINYTQFVDANVNAINITIGAFKAFVKSLVEAEWPTADEVEGEDKKDDSTSPDTGYGSSVGCAALVVLALSATVVAVRKKED